MFISLQSSGANGDELVLIVYSLVLYNPLRQALFPFGAVRASPTQDRVGCRIMKRHDTALFSSRRWQ